MRSSRRLVIPVAALAVATLALQGDLMAQPPGPRPADVTVVNTPDVRVVGAPDVTVVNVRVEASVSGYLVDP